MPAIDEVPNESSVRLRSDPISDLLEHLTWT